MAFIWISGVLLFAVAVYFIRQHFQGGVCRSTKRLDGKTVIITGANAGIGKETAIDLARRGARVIIGCRDFSRGNAAVKEIREKSGNKKVFLELLDLGSLSSVRKFAEVITKKEEKLDILINNAGIGVGPFKRTEDGFESTFGVNHLGHFLLTNLLLSKLKLSAPSRIVTVSSLGHRDIQGIDFENWNSEEHYYNDQDSYRSRLGTGYRAYCYSKLANILFTRELGKKLKGTGVTTYCLHPGVIITDIGKNLPFFKFVKFLSWTFVGLLYKSVKQGAQTSICCAVADEHANETGLYYADCAVQEPTKAAQDDQAAKKLWAMSEKLVKLQKSE